MRAVVTGAAGFIGSTLVDALLARGDSVLGVDNFTPYYDPHDKHANLAGALQSRRFELVEGDLCSLALDALCDGVDVVYHQAAQPGVRHSWAGGFADYSDNNVLATQRLLEAARTARVPRLVYASSSSVYGNAARYPCTETDLPRPHSPYGVTKLAAEHLCNLYATNWGVPTVSLRYFTVYGPRQRPDMAIHRLLEAGIHGGAFPLYGDGSAVRDFTFVADAVAANLAAAGSDCPPGSVVNIAGGSSISMRELIHLAGEALGTEIAAERREAQPGDVVRTGGRIDAAGELLGWEPRTPLREGLAAQARWHQRRPVRLGSSA
ncbi:MAG TPA: NAD-dependent epimerase/dehydratase family protein [Acidimicrobiales bacterium]|nr:NAD-dependent epimerase/dehydratase family protein [Acidimicrobiales bacterium]